VDIAKQLEIFGLEETKRLASATLVSKRQRDRMARRIDTTHDIMSSLPEGEDLSFLHSGLCQTCLPHRDGWVNSDRSLTRIIHRTARNRPRPPNTWARDFIAKNFVK